jgi:hypothetical protein
MQTRSSTPHPNPPPQGGREKQNSLPHKGEGKTKLPPPQGGGKNKTPSPTGGREKQNSLPHRGEGKTKLPPPQGGGKSPLALNMAEAKLQAARFSAQCSIHRIGTDGKTWDCRQGLFVSALSLVA